MARVTVRVVPRAKRVAVEPGSDGIRVYVRAAPEAGRATEEARRALADALGVPPSDVTLLYGATSRTKVFEVVGVSAADLRVRLGAAT